MKTNENEVIELVIQLVAACDKLDMALIALDNDGNYAGRSIEVALAGVQQGKAKEFVVAHVERTKTRASALAKLTQAEKEALRLVRIS